MSNRPSPRERGYDSEHRKIRERWAPQVRAGLIDCHARVCLEPNRRIQPGTAWDLGHTEDRTGWTGPEHARCNRADGGRRSRAAASKPLASRDW